MAQQYSVDIVAKVLGGQAVQKLEKSLEGTDKAAKRLAGTSSRAANSIRKLGDSSQQASGKVNKLGKSIRNVIGGLALLNAARFVFGKTAELERTTKQLATVTGSLKTAKGVLAELQVINKKSPFSFIELADTAKRLSAFGIENKDLVGSTERLGKAAAATGARVNDLALAYGQVAAKGKLQTEELYQFQERGIPLLKELAKGYGKTEGEVSKLIEKGRVGFPAVEQAIKNLTTGNGKFAESFENTAGTLDAKLSNAIDSLGRAAAAFGELLKPKTIEILQSFEKLLVSVTGFLKGIPQPVVNAALKFAEFADKAFLLSKAIKAIIALKAGINAVLLSTATNAGLAGTASLTAAGKVNALAVSLGRLAAIGIVTVGVNYVVNGIASGGRQEELLQGLESGTFDNTLQSLPYDQAQAALRQEEKTLTGLLAKREKLQKELKDSAGGFLNLIPGVGPARIGAKKGELNEIEAQIQKSQRILSSRTAVPPKPTTGDNPFELGDVVGGGNGGGAKGAKGAAPKTDDLKALQGQLDLFAQIQPIQDEINASRIIGNEDAIRANETYRARLELLYQQQTAVDALNTEEGRAIQRLINEKELREFNKNALTEESIAARAKATAIEDAMRPLEEQRTILEATLAGKGEEARLQLEINRLMGATPGLERAKVEELVKGNAELEKQLSETSELDKLVTDIGNQLSNGITDALVGAVAGTKDLGEAFQELASDILAAIGKALILKAITAAIGGVGAPGGGNGTGLMGLLGFAEGGFVTGPTPALVGEGGQSEYIIPESKMDGAMQRYSAGATGAAVVDGPAPSGGGGTAVAEAPPAITINGGVTQFGGNDYIRKDELPKIIDQSSKLGEARTLRRLQMSPGSRRKIGL